MMMQKEEKNLYERAKSLISDGVLGIDFRGCKQYIYNADKKSKSANNIRNRWINKKADL